jgi:integrase
MPLKLVPPRKGKSPNYSIRGTYLKVGVDRSTGTDRRAVAARILRDLEGKIERGEFPEKRQAPGTPTFLTAALTYLKARPPKRRSRAKHIGLLIKHFGDRPLDEIDQAAIDAAAVAMYPDLSPMARNEYVYMPASAILHLAGRKDPVRRPKGFKGRTVTDYLNPPDAFAIIAAAKTFDPEFALLLTFLLYTGVRVGEALALRPEDINPIEQRAWVRTSKNGKPRTLRLRGDMSSELAAHKPKLANKYFRFRQGGHFAHKLNRAKLLSLGLPCPSRWTAGWSQPPNRLQFANFHTFRHTWATWMRRYGGADVEGLVATGNWSHTRSAARYAHVHAREEWERVDRLPTAADGGEVVDFKRDAG